MCVVALNYNLSKRPVRKLSFYFEDDFLENRDRINQGLIVKNA